MEAKFGRLEKKRTKRLASMEMKVFRRTAGHTLFDRKRNEKILEELEVEPADEKLEGSNQVGYDM